MLIVPSPKDKPLLATTEPPAFEIVNAVSVSNLLLVCDHASNRVPSSLEFLGLTAAQLDDHIGWDPGAAQVARILAENLHAPLALSNYSRLVIDCNRPLSSAELIPEQSAGVIIPGNQMLSPQQQQERINQLFWPYHQAIDQLIDARLSAAAQFHPRVLLSIHSFTPSLHGELRPWNIGVAARHDQRFAQLLFNVLGEAADINVGFNQPYNIDDNFDYTLPVQGEGRGLLSAMIEIRQDGLKTYAQVMDWANRLTRAYLQIEPQLIGLLA
ncbi:MAG TPA: N-formylglutamate amidohydrolase [Cellvibrionaceae bacterium]